MTGILMSGKISVAVRRRTTGVRIRIRSAITMKVYGLRNANATIHIDDYPDCLRSSPKLAHPVVRRSLKYRDNRCETVSTGFIFHNLPSPCRDPRRRLMFWDVEPD